MFFSGPLAATYDQARFIIFGTEQKLGLCRACGLAGKFNNKLRKASSLALILLVRLISLQSNPVSHDVFLSVVQTIDKAMLESMRIGDHILYGDLTTKEAAETFLFSLKQAPAKNPSANNTIKVVALKDAHLVAINSPTAYYQEVQTSPVAPITSNPPQLSQADSTRTSGNELRASYRDTKRSTRDHANLNTLNDDAMELSEADDNSIGSLSSVSEEDDDDDDKKSINSLDALSNIDLDALPPVPDLPSLPDDENLGNSTKDYSRTEMISSRPKVTDTDQIKRDQALYINPMSSGDTFPECSLPSELPSDLPSSPADESADEHEHSTKYKSKQDKSIGDVGISTRDTVFTISDTPVSPSRRDRRSDPSTPSSSQYAKNSRPDTGLTVDVATSTPSVTPAQQEKSGGVQAMPSSGRPQSGGNLPSLVASQPDSRSQAPYHATASSPTHAQTPTQAPSSIKGRFKSLFSIFRSSDSAPTTPTSGAERGGMAFDPNVQAANSGPGFIFGKTIRQLVAEGRCDANCVPLFLRKIMDFIVKNQEMVKTDSIFRLNGDSSVVQKLKFEIDSLQPLDVFKWDVHSLTTVVKLWLREMPDPVVPYSLYDPLLEAYQNEQEDRVFDLLDTMPNEERLLYQYIVTMCVRVASYHQSNFMTMQNLAIVFAPNIFRSKVPVYSKMVKEMPLSIGVLQLSMKAVEASFAREHRPRQGTIVIGSQRSFLALSTGFTPGSRKAGSSTSAQDGSSAIVDSPEMIVEEMECEDEEELEIDNTNFAFKKHSARTSIADMNQQNMDQFRLLEGKLKPSLSSDDSNTDRQRRSLHQPSAEAIAEADETEDHDSQSVVQGSSKTAPIPIQTMPSSMEAKKSTASKPIAIGSTTSGSAALSHPQSSQLQQKHGGTKVSGPSSSSTNSSHSTGSTPGTGPASPPQGMQYSYAFSGSPTNASSLRTLGRGGRSSRRVASGTGFTPSSPSYIGAVGTPSSPGVHGMNLSAPGSSGMNSISIQKRSSGPPLNQNTFTPLPRTGQSQTLTAAQIQSLSASHQSHPHSTANAPPANSSATVSSLTLKMGSSGSIPNDEISLSTVSAVSTSTSATGKNESLDGDNDAGLYGDEDEDDDMGGVMPPPPPPMRGSQTDNMQEYDELPKFRRASFVPPSDPFQLADGWVEFADPNNTTYYYHPISNTASWIRPCYENRKKVLLQPTLTLSTKALATSKT